MPGYQGYGNRNKGQVVLAVLIALVFTSLLFFVPYMLDQNKAWRNNEKINGLLEAATSGENTRLIDKGAVIEQPYVVFFLRGNSERSADMHQAKIWDKPFLILNDRNIAQTSTFVFVLNRQEDWSSYTDGSSIATFSAIIQYFDKSGEFLGCEFIEADPVPEKKQSGNQSLTNQYVSKSKVLDAVESHLGESETE